MKNFIFKSLGALAILGVVVLGVGFIEYKKFTSEPIRVAGNGFSYEVKAGSTLKKVAIDLANERIIPNADRWVWTARILGSAHQIQAGEYLLTANLTAATLLDKMTSGDTVQYGMTIIEGWSFEQLLNQISKNKHLKPTLKGLSHQQIMVKLKLDDKFPEGLFLPDTYHFPRGTSDLAFLQRANQAMQHYLDQAWQDRAENLPYKNAYEALIMASIVEKETGAPEERPRIAGVFVRRLEKRMRLQTDPTVIYGLGKAYKGNIKRRHLKQDTPYNTYTRFGLPPTPIALPGRKAIDAALHPDDGKELYFVARGDGSHEFNQTLRDHNNDVIKYQLKGKRKRFSSYKN